MRVAVNPFQIWVRLEGDELKKGKSKGYPKGQSPQEKEEAKLRRRGKGKGSQPSRDPFWRRESWSDEERDTWVKNIMGMQIYRDLAERRPLWRHSAGGWKCAQCGGGNFCKAERCKRCEQDKPEEASTETEEMWEKWRKRLNERNQEKKKTENERQSAKRRSGGAENNKSWSSGRWKKRNRNQARSRSRGRADAERRSRSPRRGGSAKRAKREHGESDKSLERSPKAHPPEQEDEGEGTGYHDEDDQRTEERNSPEEEGSPEGGDRGRRASPGRAGSEISQGERRDEEDDDEEAEQEDGEEGEEHVRRDKCYWRDAYDGLKKRTDDLQEENDKTVMKLEEQVESRDATISPLRNSTTQRRKNEGELREDNGILRERLEEEITENDELKQQKLKLEKRLDQALASRKSRSRSPKR